MRHHQKRLLFHAGRILFILGIWGPLGTQGGSRVGRAPHRGDPPRGSDGNDDDGNDNDDDDDDGNDDEHPDANHPTCPRAQG